MIETGQMGVRRFGRVNWLGTWTLVRREISRFMNVWSQTIMAPLINAGLFLMIFKFGYSRISFSYFIILCFVMEVIRFSSNYELE